MLTSFELDAKPGHTRLTVAGTDVSDTVASAVVEVGGPGTVPQLTVTQHAGAAAIAGEGVVTVVRAPDDEAVGTAVVEFLESIDPSALVPMVEARFTSLSSSPVALTLDVLIGIAREVAGG